MYADKNALMQLVYNDDDRRYHFFLAKRNIEGAFNSITSENNTYHISRDARRFNVAFSESPELTQQILSPDEEYENRPVSALINYRFIDEEIDEDET